MDIKTRQIDLDFAQLSLDREEIYRTMGYGDNTPDAEIQRILDEVLSDARRICRPRILYGICPGRVVPPVHVEAQGVEFRTGKIISDSLSGADRFCIFVATAGREFEDYRHALKQAGECVREFVADSVGSVAAEASVAVIERQLDQELDVPHTYPYSPGYCGWRVTEQQLLFGLLPEHPCGIELTESSLMYPIKSVSGIIGIGEKVERRPYGCAICGNVNCYKRRPTA